MGESSAVCGVPCSWWGLSRPSSGEGCSFSLKPQGISSKADQHVIAQVGVCGLCDTLPNRLSWERRMGDRRQVERAVCAGQAQVRTHTGAQPRRTLCRTSKDAFTDGSSRGSQLLNRG